jgi:hypothetical protein
VQEEFLEQLSKENPTLLKNLRGFMKTGSWARANNPNYVKLLSDFDMTVVCDDLASEEAISKKLRQFMDGKGFNTKAMDIAIFPVDPDQAAEVYKGGAKKFVDVYNETEGAFDAISFDKHGNYKGVVRGQSPEASFGVVYRNIDGKRVRIVQDFAKFTYRDAPDLMLKEQEDFIAFLKKLKSGGEISKTEMKKIGKFASRSAYGNKILTRSMINDLNAQFEASQ